MAQGMLRHIIIILIFSYVTPVLANNPTACQSMSAIELHENIVAGKFASLACAEELVSLIDLYDDVYGYNAFIAYHKSSIFRQAKRIDQNDKPLGVLAGIPIVVKDNIDVKGYSTTAGTYGLRNNFAQADAAVIKKLKDAGAIILGKTNMHELAAGVTSINFLYGPVRNPYNKNMFAGGSSGGSAAAIALGYAPVGLGTDTEGSVRIPSALSGVIGFRPSFSRYSLQGVVPAATTFDTIGLMARHVADIILLDQVLTDQHTVTVEPIASSSLRLGVPKQFFYENLDPNVERVMTETLKRLQAAGITLVIADIPELENHIEIESIPIAMYEFIHDLRAYLREKHLRLSTVIDTIRSPDVKFVYRMFSSLPISKARYEQAIKIQRPALETLYKDYFVNNHVDAIIFPATPLPARPINNALKSVSLNNRQISVYIYSRNLMPGANAGLPSITIPAGLTDDGLPVGLEIEALPQQDDRLLQIALSLEKILPTLPRPSVH